MSGFSWSERTNSGMVKQEELWTNLSFSTCNLLIIAMSDLNKTQRVLTRRSFWYCNPNTEHNLHDTPKYKKYFIDKFEKL